MEIDIEAKEHVVFGSSFAFIYGINTHICGSIYLSALPEGISYLAIPKPETLNPKP